MTESSVLVTGACGEIGKALVQALARRGHRIVTADLAPLPESIRSLSAEHLQGDLVQRAKQFYDYDFEVVYHLAASLSSKAEAAPEEAHRINVDGTMQLLLMAAYRSEKLSIDVHEQELAQQALQWGIKTAGLKGGVVIVMNPQTGEILAMVSLPTYDDNAFAQGISSKAYQALLDNKYKPLLNHAISEQYPPGSTYKLVTGSAGLADHKITPTTLIRTASFLKIGTATFRDWKPGGFGLCNLYCGFGHSSDTYFYQVAAKVGIDRLGYWAKQFGFGARTGIDLPGEASGTVPTNQWKLETLGVPDRKSVV